jgi:DNA polymerase IV (DinB-like DNA polymerase)
VSQIERAGLDEMYFDLSFAGSYEKAAEISREVKADIREKEGLTASIGIGPNKLIAKIASDMKKPDGLTVIKEEDAATFLEPLSVRKLPGIGPKTEIMLNGLGIRKISGSRPRPRKARRAHGQVGSLSLRDGSGLTILQSRNRERPSRSANRRRFLKTRSTGIPLQAQGDGDELPKSSEEGFGFRTVGWSSGSPISDKIQGVYAENPIRSSDEMFSVALRLLLPF